MKKRIPLLLHLLLWLALLAFSLWTHFNLGPLSTIPVTWLSLDVAQTLAFHLALFYFNWFVLVPKILARGRVLLYALAVIGTLALYASVRVPLEISIKKNLAAVNSTMAAQIRKHPGMLEWDKLLLQLAMIGVMNIFLSSGLRVTGDFLRNERRRKELELRQTSTELELLKAQVNPHFLFNTLNNIYSLAYKNSADTPDAIMKLSLLLRYQLYETDTDRVPLEKELEHLQNLLDLHRLRLPQPELLQLKTQGPTAAVQLPPMLLMPLVENMFKHGFTTAPMTVHLHVEANRLTFSTRNTVKPNQTKEAFGGIGLQNLRRRLTLLYPGAHTLEAHTRGNSFDAVLTLTKLT